MKQILCILTMMLLASVQVHSKQVKKSEWETRRERCDAGAELAEGVMKARQRGVSIREMYAALGEFDADTRKAFEMIVRAAYTVPIADTPDSVEVVTLEFTNGFFSYCMEPD